MLTRRFSSLALVLIVAATLDTAGASPQCPSWQVMGSGSDIFPVFTATDQPTIYASVVDSSGTVPALYVGGFFAGGGGVPAPNVARWSGGTWQALGSPTVGYVHALARHDVGSGTELYAGGNFTQIGGATADGVARWDGSTWHALGLLSPSACYGLVSGDIGSGPLLYVAGDLHWGSGTASVASWDGSSWTALGNLPGMGVKLCIADLGAGPTLFALRHLSQFPNVTTEVLSWSGTTWVSIAQLLFTGSGNLLSSLGTYHSPSGTKLCIGGAFTQLGGLTVTNIATWNGTTLGSLPGLGGLDPFDGVRAIAEFDDGTGAQPGLFAAQHSRVCRWDGSAWTIIGSPGSILGVSMYSMSVFDDQTGSGPGLYVMGAFASFAGQVANDIAIWRGCQAQSTPFCFGDGSSGPCPCANGSAGGRGCENSASTGGARLFGLGTASLAVDSLRLVSTGELPVALSIFLQGDASSGAQNFGDGLRCTGGTLRKLYIRNASGGTISVPQPGDPSISLRSAAVGDVLTAGATRYYQTYYRDPAQAFCPAPQGNNWNISSGVSILWAP